MNLSMWTLFGWLERREFHPAPVISSGKPVLTGARLMERGAPGADTVAVISAHGVAGGEGYEVALANNMDLIFLPQCESSAVMNEVTACFEFFNQWERSMLLALVNGSTLQDMLNLTHQVFHQPMFIKGDSSWVFAITPGYSPNVHPDWANLERSAVNRTADFESVKAVSLDPEFQKVFLQRTPTILRSPLYGGMVLRTNVWLDEQRVCEIVALEYNAKFNAGDAYIMQTFSDMVSRYISANRSLYFSFSGLTNFFTGLLERQECNPANLQMVWQATGWKEQDEMAVAVVREKTQCESPMLGVLRETLTKQLPNSCVFYFEGRVVCIVNVTKTGGYSAAVRRLEEIVPKDSFTWGISYEFQGLEQVPEYDKQALSALEVAEAKGAIYQTMYQAAYSCISSELKKVRTLQGYIHPDLRRLQQVDRQGDSQYLPTLYHFLLCGGNYTDAAAHLGLHRNSLIYRMSRIQELISSDLSGSENRRLLLVSFLLLGQE